MFTHDKKILDLSRLACSFKALIIIDDEIRSIFYEDYAYSPEDIEYLVNAIEHSKFSDSPDLVNELKCEVKDWVQSNKGKPLKDVLSKMFHLFDCP